MIKVIFISVQIIGTILGLVILYKALKVKRVSPCDSCKNLDYKSNSMWEYRYRCGGPLPVSGAFDKAPTYCKYYEPRRADDIYEFGVEILDE